MTAQTLDPHRIQICRVAPINYDNGQPCACPEGTCSLWKGGLNPAKRPRGRPVVPEEARLLVGTVRLTQAQWDKLATLGGAEWLRKAINRAKVKT